MISPTTRRDLAFLASAPFEKGAALVCARAAAAHTKRADGLGDFVSGAGTLWNQHAQPLVDAAANQAGAAFSKGTVDSLGATAKEWGNTATDYLQNNPGVGGALLGGLGGAALGGVSNLFRKKKKFSDGALYGGLLGAGMGGLAGAAYGPPKNPPGTAAAGAPPPAPLPGNLDADSRVSDRDEALTKNYNALRGPAENALGVLRHQASLGDEGARKQYEALRARWQGVHNAVALGSPGQELSQKVRGLLPDLEQAAQTPAVGKSWWTGHVGVDREPALQAGAALHGLDRAGVGRAFEQPDQPDALFHPLTGKPGRNAALLGGTGAVLGGGIGLRRGHPIKGFVGGGAVGTAAGTGLGFAGKHAPGANVFKPDVVYDELRMPTPTPEQVDQFAGRQRPGAESP